MPSQLESLRQAISVSPDNVPLLLLLGEACLQDFLADEARAAYEKALRLEPARQEAKLGLARALHLGGKTSEAFIRAESLAGENPQYAAAWLFLARLNLAEEQHEQAASCYQKARSLDPGVDDPALQQKLDALRPPEAKEKKRAPLRTHDWEPDEPDYEDDEDEDEEGEEKLKPGDVEQPKTQFSDIGGMEAVKEEIRMKILYPIQNPQLFKAYGKAIGGGVLLYGPPGCGKTLLSRATAGEIKATFLSIGLHEILDLYIGNSEKNLHHIFELARANTPTVLFFDEIDAMAANRNDFKHSNARTLINQFLTELDGSVSRNDGLLVLGATNAPWHIDPAFRRPGRFDRILFVPPPDEAARREIIGIMARDKPVADLDVNAIAKKTKDFSGADLKLLFDMTIERCLARAMKDGNIAPITTKEMLQTLGTIKPSCRSWFESAKNYALYANQGGFYDDVLDYLGLR